MDQESRHLCNDPRAYRLTSETTTSRAESTPGNRQATYMEQHKVDVFINNRRTVHQTFGVYGTRKRSEAEGVTEVLEDNTRNPERFAKTVTLSCQIQGKPETRQRRTVTV